MGEILLELGLAASAASILASKRDNAAPASRLRSSLPGGSEPVLRTKLEIQARQPDACVSVFLTWEPAIILMRYYLSKRTKKRLTRATTRRKKKKKNQSPCSHAEDETLSGHR